jgi:hypothetical protein
VVSSRCWLWEGAETAAVSHQQTAEGLFGMAVASLKKGFGSCSSREAVSPMELKPFEKNIWQNRFASFSLVV